MTQRRSARRAAWRMAGAAGAAAAGLLPSLLPAVAAALTWQERRGQLRLHLFVSKPRAGRGWEGGRACRAANRLALRVCAACPGAGTAAPSPARCRAPASCHQHPICAAGDSVHGTCCQGLDLAPHSALSGVAVAQRARLACQGPGHNAACRRVWIAERKGLGAQLPQHGPGQRSAA